MNIKNGYIYIHTYIHWYSLVDDLEVHIITIFITLKLKVNDLMIHLIDI